MAQVLGNLVTAGLTRGPGDSRIVLVIAGYSWEPGAESRTPSNTCSNVSRTQNCGFVATQLVGFGYSGGSSYGPARDKVLSDYNERKHHHPSGRVNTFDLAFLHQFESAMRPLLPKICWNQVEDLEIEWVEMRAKLQQQPYIDPETTKSQLEQEITAVSAKIQAEIDEDQEIKHKTAHQQFSKNEPEEDAEISYRTKIQTTRIHTNSSSNSQVKGEVGITDITDQRLISQLRQDKVDAIKLDVSGSSDGDATGGFEERRTGEWSELEEVVVARKPPWEPPDLNLKTVVTDGEMQRKTDPCLKTIPEASPCTTDGKAELRGTDNVTDLSPVTVILGKTATTKIFESAHYRSMDAGGERDTSNSSTEDGAVAAERRRTLGEQTPEATVGDGAALVLCGKSSAHAICRAMLLNPPPLMAVVFPWDCDSEIATTMVPLGNQNTDNRAAKNVPWFQDQCRGGDEYGGSVKLLGVGHKILGEEALE
ncbi:hypothetical protein PIB30_038533 [Stylosanthes scabra]|uniref:Uncharacterized protein n=1 Tax=Stylosanthes scabra TaxID=79078 RepID=A0ABU6VD20_9FABA|nr:hypothetical protein [Stylosanthes scabra]